VPDRYMVRLVFPHALIVADAFHLHRCVLEALTTVRRSATHRIVKGRSRRAGLPKHARYALARGRDELLADTTERGARQQAAVAEACGLDPPIALAYQLKEAFRTLMKIGKSATSRPSAPASTSSTPSAASPSSHRSSRRRTGYAPGERRSSTARAPPARCW